MRLYLSSYLWGNRPEELFKLIDVGSSSKKIGIITNSADLFPAVGVRQRLEDDIDFLKTQGFEAEQLDLRDYFKASATALEEKIRSFGLVWAKGANAFVLRRAMHQSGFDEVIVRLLKEDIIVYGGYSAGACVMGSRLRGLELVDDAKSVPEGYDEVPIWEGLGVLDYAIAPHYKSVHPESELIDKVIEFWDKKKQPYLALSDGEALIIDGDGSDEKVVS